jgi:lyso-ornithine lipid O-acyltransferase
VSDGKERVTVLRRGARTAFRTAGFASLTAASLPAFVARMAITPEHNRRVVRDAWVRDWAERMLRLFDVRSTVLGETPPPHGALIVANHRSAIDVGVLLHIFGGRMVSRADLAAWPVLGPAARATGTLFVDRSSRKSGADVIRQIEQALRAGDTVCLFPEGTTFEGDLVRSFHGGAFMAACRAGAPIVPVGLAYQTGSDVAFVGTTFGKHLLTVAGGTGARITVAIGAAVPANASSKSLARDLRTSVQQLVTAARAHVDS